MASKEIIPSGNQNALFEMNISEMLPIAYFNGLELLEYLTKSL